MNSVKNIDYKQKITVIGLMGLTLLTIVVLKMGSTLADPNSNYLKNQEVDGLAFEDANVVYEDGKTTFTVNVYNYGDEEYSLKTININFRDKDGNMNTLIGYIGDKLKVEEGRQLTASIDKDITNSINLEYVINR